MINKIAFACFDHAMQDRLGGGLHLCFNVAQLARGEGLGDLAAQSFVPGVVGYNHGIKHIGCTRRYIHRDNAVSRREDVRIQAGMQYLGMFTQRPIADAGYAKASFALFNKGNRSFASEKSEGIVRSPRGYSQKF